ncbi:Variant-specific surface protein [Giardia duodenalis]|uniref:Variant-specific surface protein n=1 Tax=Giardia intestinalis TaxID=5741 RepID=V6TMR8_GIAIN|nr:Variant-specific surface protein [Giardia intestinalis]
MLLAIYFAVGALAAACKTDGNHTATCANEKCEVIGQTEVCTQCKAGGVPIDGFCRPSTSPQAITAGCTGKDGAALTDSSTACGMCSGEFFLFMGGCYSTKSNSGGSICTKAEGGKCATCKTEGSYIFQNKAATVTPGNECILCSDATDRDGAMGVANCNKCTAPGSAGAATCSACQAGYVRDQTNNECKKCGTGCSTCSASNQQGCTACLEGKYLDGNTCIDASSCTGAKYPDPKTNKCIQCNAAAEQGGIPECTACMYSDSLQKPVCSNCGSGGKLLRIDLDGTTTCVDDAGCADGKTHFVIDESRKKCLLCNDTITGSTDANKGVDHCKTCTKTGAQKPVCSACLDGYYGTTSCTACTGANCATCNDSDPSKCVSCKPGFFLKDASTGECVPCDNVDKGGREGCSACSNNPTFKCADCRANYRKQPNGGASDDYTCTKTCEDDSACGGTAGACDAIVISASGEITYYCSLCGDSTKIPIDGKCVDKNTNANGNTCENGVCTQCTDGYFLYMGGCYKADQPPGNLMCKTAAGGICTITTSQYFKIPGATDKQQSVLACENPVGTAVGERAYVGVEGCKTCEAPTAATGMAAAKCTACDEGKKPNLAGTGCSTCDIAGCSACKADNMCEAYGDGHRLEGDTCVRTGGGNLSTGAITGISVAKSSYALCG